MKTIHRIMIVLIVIALTGPVSAQSHTKGTGDTHNGEYIVPNPKDSSGSALTTGDKTTAGKIQETPVAASNNNNSNTPGAGTNDNSAPVASTTTTTNTENSTGGDNCCGGKWGLLGLLGLLGLFGLRGKKANG